VTVGIGADQTGSSAAATTAATTASGDRITGAVGAAETAVHRQLATLAAVSGIDEMGVGPTGDTAAGAAAAGRAWV
jgi:hypothetical protein